ncbi:MAG: SDR family oxidoreductase [Clostridia bacterium]|nr:SDR family oxidoreductase [Clostridia bacterium]
MKNPIRSFIKSFIKQRYGTIIPANISILGTNELLRNRKALVTGGGNGIGKAIVEEFLKAGCDVVFTSRNEEKAKHCEEEFRKIYPNRKILGIKMDIRQVDSFQYIFNIIVTQFGSIDILVNNAGVGEGWWCHTSVEEFDNVIETNLRGPFFLTEIVARYMRDNNIKGNILNICSSAGLRPANTAYRLSKWSMRAFTLGLAKTLIPYDIVVNGIAPGPTATAMMARQDNSNLSKPGSPSGRMATPQEIANMAVIYVSNMSRTIVGDICYMAGGSGLLTVDDTNIYTF